MSKARDRAPFSQQRMQAECPKQMYHASPAERWTYFLRNADKLTPHEIRRLFPDQEFSEAAGVLEMISRTPDPPNN
jgi:hypothetical protein